MINKGHQIESTIIEISFPNEETALSEHNSLESFMRKRMFSSISNVFDEFSEENTIYSIEKLEMDLGTIPLQFFHEDFESRLIAKLREIISEELSRSSQHSDKKIRKISQLESDFEVICDFLEFGKLRWNARVTNKAALSQVLENVVENNSMAFKEFILNSTRKMEILKRLSSQFETTTLCDLFEVMFKTDSRELEEIILGIIALIKERLRISPSNLIQTIWLGLLENYFSRGRGVFRLEDVIVITMKSIPSQEENYLDILDKLLAHAEVMESDSRLIQLMEQILRDTNASSPVKELSLDSSDSRILTELGADGQSSRTGERARILAFRAKLIEAINTGFVGRILPYWSELFLKYSATTEEVIYTLGQRKEARKNIAWKFPEPLIVEIVKLLEPTHYTFVERMVSEPKLFLQAEKDLELEESEAKKSLWEFTLTYLIVERGSRFNRKSYIASIMHQMSAHINVDLADLYESLITLLEPVSVSNAMRSELLDLLVELKGEIFENSSPSQKRVMIKDRSNLQPEEYDKNRQIFSQELDQIDSDDTSESSSVKFSERNSEQKISVNESTYSQEPNKSVVDAFYRAFREGRPNLVNAIWSDLLKSYQDWFLQTIRRVGQHQQVRRNISRNFSEAMLIEIVEVIDPVNSEFIHGFVKGASDNRTKTPHEEIKSPSSTYKENLKISRSSVWEFTLGYLLVERGSRFNQKMFLTSVIRQLAAHENVSAKAMYDVIMTSILSQKISSSYHGQTIALLKELGAEFKDAALGVASAESINLRDERLEKDLTFPENSRPERVADESKQRKVDEQQIELIRAYILYEKLFKELSYVESSEVLKSHQLVRLFHELLEYYPWMLHRFNQELSSGTWSVARFIPKMPSTLQRRLLISYFNSFKNRFGFNEDKFLSSIARFEKNISLTEHGYLAIFNNIVNEKIVDLEIIFSGDYKNPQGFEDAFYNAPSSSDVINDKEKPDRIERKFKFDPLPLNQRTYDLARAYLHGNLKLDSKNRQLLADFFERILNNKPDLLRELLDESMFDTDSVSRLTSVMQESVLVRILLLMCPNDQVKTVIYSDLLVVAFIDAQKSLGIQVRDLHALKWQFILSYLIVEGRRFNEVNFNKNFVKFLINQVKAGDRQTFFNDLIASITSTSIPTTHTYSARAAMILSNSLQEFSSFWPQVESSDSRNKLLEKHTGHASSDKSFKKTLSSSLDGFSEEETDFTDAIYAEDDPSKEETDFTDAIYAGDDSSKEETDFTDATYAEDDPSKEEADIEEDIYIGNAGLVLLSPYLPRYFESLGLVEGRAFKDRVAAERGVHLLQFMLDGSSSNPEFLLVLNKILCGIKTGVPIIQSINISQQEMELSKSLLHGVIGNWPALKNSSVDGLRESFLQRDAHLQLKDDTWKLLVEAKPFDMLLDEIPWNYKTIKMPWMANLISVDWR